MKNMDSLIDSNVILDSLLKRGDFAADADKIIKYCRIGLIRGVLASHSLTNIFYILRKQYGLQERKEIILTLCDMFEVYKIDVNMIYSALSQKGFIDLEDSLQIQCAIATNVDYIITRDPKGFENSPIKAVSPRDFLQLH